MRLLMTVPPFRITLATLGLSPGLDWDLDGNCETAVIAYHAAICFPASVEGGIG